MNTTTSNQELPNLELPLLSPLNEIRAKVLRNPHEILTSMKNLCLDYITYYPELTDELREVARLAIALKEESDSVAFRIQNYESSTLNQQSTKPIIEHEL